VRAIVGLLILLTSGVASAGSTDIVAVDDVINAPRGLFGRTRAAVEQALGPPLSVRPHTLPATPTAPPEAAQQLVYPGVVVTVSSRSSSVRGVAISEPRWALPRGLNVGTPRAQVEAVLGEPQLIGDTSVLYLDADGFPNTVEFHFRGGAVRRIEWSYAASD
jgi:hypothetical protein